MSYGQGNSEQYSELDDGSISRYKATNHYYDIYEYKPTHQPTQNLYTEGQNYAKTSTVSTTKLKKYFRN